MSRASEDLLDLIHKLAATALKDEIERAIERASKPRTVEGEGGPVPNPDYAPVNPQLIDKALKFLKDNGVDAPAKSERVDALAQQLSELNLDDEAIELRTQH